MSKISKYNQAIFVCTAAVVASLGSFVQSASAGGNYCSNCGNPAPHIPVTINSNPGNPVPPVTINSNPGNPPVTANSDPGNPGPGPKPPKGPKPPVNIGSDPTNPPGNPPITIGSDPNNPPGTPPKPGEKPKPPVTIGSDPTNPTVQPGKPGKFNSSESGSINTATSTGSNAANSDGGGGRFSSSTIATAKGVQGKFLAAMSKYEIASAALAAAEAGQNNASSSTSPVRYGREPGDIAACGCPNADVPTAGTPSKELVAAKAAEAEAAAELAAAKAEARQFLESVKENGSTGITFQPVW